MQISTSDSTVSLGVLHPVIVALFLQETRTLAEIAKAELDGTVINDRPIRIRFPLHSAALTVRNLLPVVTNELLEQVNWTRDFQYHC